VVVLLLGSSCCTALRAPAVLRVPAPRGHTVRLQLSSNEDVAEAIDADDEEWEYMPVYSNDDDDGMQAEEMTAAPPPPMPSQPKAAPASSPLALPTFNMPELPSLSMPSFASGDALPEVQLPKFNVPKLPTPSQPAAPKTTGLAKADTTSAPATTAPNPFETLFASMPSMPSPAASKPSKPPAAATKPVRAAASKPKAPRAASARRPVAARPPPPAPASSSASSNPIAAFFESLFGPKSARSSAAEKGLPTPPDTFEEDLSAWPALLSLKASLEAMSPQEQRRQKLEVGTNWPPRTTTAMDGVFDNGREGYMFFQGPSPLTAVQPNLASFLSKESLAGVAVPKQLVLFAGLGGLSGLAVLLVLLDVL